MSIQPSQDLHGALAVLRAAGTGARLLPVTAPVATIGSGAENDIVLADDSVSAKHARLAFEDGAWRLYDLGSTNGTRVSGTRLDSGGAPATVRDGDTLQFGGARAGFDLVEGVDPSAVEISVEPEEDGRPRAAGFRLPLWVLVLLILLVVLIVLLLLNVPATAVTLEFMDGTMIAIPPGPTVP